MRALLAALFVFAVGCYGGATDPSSSTSSAADAGTCVTDESLGGSGTYDYPANTGGAPYIMIPQGASVVGAWVSAVSWSTTSPTPNVGLVEQSTPGTIGSVYGFTDPEAHFVPITEGSTRLVVTNLDTVNGVTVSVTWVIDG